MQELRRQPSVADVSTDHGVPSYLIYFGVPPFLAAFIVSAIDPMAGLALLACLTVMVITINIFVRVCTKRGLLRTKG